MPEKRTEALMVTPLPPMETGLATYAVRVIENTVNFIDWTVAYPSGYDIDSLSVKVKSMPIEELEEGSLPDARIFQIGNSLHCFPVVQALYKFGGTALFHETVLHHMLRHSYLKNNRLKDYRRELRFSFGPDAESVEKELSNEKLSALEYDTKLKQYPLIGRVIHSSHSAVCMNSYAFSILKKSFPGDRITTIGHPLSKLPELNIPPKPYSVCFGMVGANNPGRNLDSILQAVELLRNDIPESGLILIGSGYPEGLPEWVTVTGRLKEKEYQSWIRTLDYLFDVRHPTCGETSGSLLEAMRAGIPTIVTATGSFNNLPSDAVIRIPPDSIVQGLRSAVLFLEERSDLKKNLSEKTMSYALDTGSLNRLERDWKRVLHLAGSTPADDFPLQNISSISPAWHEPPRGFERDLNTTPVTWKFSGNAKLEGPEYSSGAIVTVWGSGTAGSTELQIKPSVVTIDGRILHFTGNGWVSSVFWK